MKMPVRTLLVITTIIGVLLGGYMLIPDRCAFHATAEYGAATAGDEEITQKLESIPGVRVASVNREPNEIQIAGTIGFRRFSKIPVALFTETLEDFGYQQVRVSAYD